MRKFNRDKVLNRLELKRKWRNCSKYFYIGIPCLLCCILGIYFAYSKFFVSKEEDVVQTKVGDFIYGDVVIGAYIDGKYSSTIPSKDDGYIVEKVVCDNDATGTWNNDSWGLLTTNLTKRTKCNIYFEEKPILLTEKVTELSSTDTTNFAKDDADNNIRYIGSNPNNYVYFNCSDYANQSDSTCEKWRIIGLFNNVTKSDGSKENLIKIIRDDSIGNYSWDNKQSGVGTSTTNNGSNDWTDSQLMMMLNPVDYLKSGYTNSNDIISLNGQEIYSKMGSYYNGTKGCKPASITSGSTFTCTEVDFTSTGLKNNQTRNAIENVVWNLGGSIDVTVSIFYSRERGTTVYSGHATTWTGKIGLMYPSDYGYATSGGSTTDRATCLVKELVNWNSSDVSDCKNNDYLYKSSIQWTFAPSSSHAHNVFFVNSTGRVDNYGALNDRGVRPALYLKSDISIDTQEGDGSSSNPYRLKM